MKAHTCIVPCPCACFLCLFFSQLHHYFPWDYWIRIILWSFYTELRCEPGRGGEEDKAGSTLIIITGEAGSESAQCYVCCESKTWIESKNVKDSLVDLLATYYVFDIAYPAALAPIFTTLCVGGGWRMSKSFLLQQGNWFQILPSFRLLHLTVHVSSMAGIFFNFL